MNTTRFLAQPCGGRPALTAQGHAWGWATHDDLNEPWCSCPGTLQRFVGTLNVLSVVISEQGRENTVEPVLAQYPVGDRSIRLVPSSPCAAGVGAPCGALGTVLLCKATASSSSPSGCPCDGRSLAVLSWAGSCGHRSGVFIRLRPLIKELPSQPPRGRPESRAAARGHFPGAASSLGHGCLFTVRGLFCCGLSLCGASIPVLASTPLRAPVLVRCQVGLSAPTVS